MPRSANDYDAASEVTAVLSILKEGDASHRLPGNAPGDHFRYTILLWLVGRVLMPPYLPRIIEHVRAGSRIAILRRLTNLVKLYEQAYANYELSDADAAQVLEDVTLAGEDIAKYIKPLHGCLEALATSELNIKNLVIHTDEHTIPWHLALSDHLGEFDFLCNRYACGTVLVDDSKEGALSRFLRYSKRGRQPDINELPGKQFFLIAGEVGQTTPEGKDLGLAYVEKLKERLQANSKCTMEIQCISAGDWKKQSKDPVESLRSIFRYAQIVHFTGHFIDGRMKLSDNLLIGEAELAGLPELTSKPLVVLHGCASAGPAGASGEGAQVCRAFLNKGAGGCLATVLPVNIPTEFSNGAETLIEIFYKNIFKNPARSYGAALKEARREFRNRSRLNDPQALFYHLFGDPRETLVSMRALTVQEILMGNNLDHFAAPPPQKSTISFRISGGDIKEKQQEMVEALLAMDGVQDATLQKPAAALGLGLELGYVVMTMVVVGPGSQLPDVIQRIGDRFRKRFSGAKAELISPEPLSTK
jgi:hypothetical protein